MKRILNLLPVCVFAIVSSCNVIDDEFSETWIDDYTNHFDDRGWKDVDKNLFPVQPVNGNGLDVESTPQRFPDEGTLLMVNRVGDETLGVCFESLALVDPTEEPDNWTPDQGESWVRCAYYINFAIREIPFQKTADGEMKFSKKTQVGTINFAHWSGCMVSYYKQIRDCKVSISGSLSQAGTGSNVSSTVPFTGDLEIKIITPDNDHWILHYDKLNPMTCDSGFLSHYL